MSLKIDSNYTTYRLSGEFEEIPQTPTAPAVTSDMMTSADSSLCAPIQFLRDLLSSLWQAIIHFFSRSHKDEDKEIEREIERQEILKEQARLPHESLFLEIAKAYTHLMHLHADALTSEEIVSRSFNVRFGKNSVWNLWSHNTLDLFTFFKKAFHRLDVPPQITMGFVTIDKKQQMKVSAVYIDQQHKSHFFQNAAPYKKGENHTLWTYS